MFYVYELIDPRDSRPFYVGKGSGNRVKEHAKEARAGKSGAKCERIREIWAVGLEIVERIIREFEDERLAYVYERRHIARIGRQNLTNIAPGGGGVRERAVSEQPRTVDRFEVFAFLAKAFHYARPRKGALMAQALYRELARSIPRTLDELVQDFGHEAVKERLAEFNLLYEPPIENNV